MPEMKVGSSQGPLETESRPARVDVSTFKIPKNCERSGCLKRATRAIVFASPDPALPMRVQFLCSTCMRKRIEQIQAMAEAQKGKA